MLLTLRIALTALLTVSPAVASQDMELQSMLRSTDPAVRVRALRELAASKSGNALPSLLNAAQDMDPFVRAGARAGLITLGTSAIDALANDLTNANAALQARAAHQLLNLLGTDPSGAMPISTATEAAIRTATSAWRCSDVCLEKWVRPVYPGPARITRVEGLVWVTFSVVANGSPENISASGHLLLEPAAVAAIKQWRFSVKNPPAKPERQTVLVEFRLVPTIDDSLDTAVEMTFPSHVVVVTSHLVGPYIDRGDVTPSK